MQVRRGQQRDARRGDSSLAQQGHDPLAEPRDLVGVVARLGSLLELVLARPQLIVPGTPPADAPEAAEDA